MEAPFQHIQGATQKFGESHHDRHNDTWRVAANILSKFDLDIHTLKFPFGEQLIKITFLLSLFMCVYIYIYIYRERESEWDRQTEIEMFLVWYNGYCHRKWTWWLEFKFCIRLFTFHIAWERYESDYFPSSYW